MAGRRLAIIGAGPIGLEAAVRGQQSGWNVTLLEQGTVGEHVSRWGHVRLFSPFGMNSSERGRAALAGSMLAGTTLPADDSLLTGREFVERYLRPLSNLPLLQGRIREHTRVVAIGRTGLWKSDRIGRPERTESPFRLLLDTPTGEETVTADVVLDCSGTFSQHNWLGAGGIPCPGERANADRIDYQIPDIEGADRDRFAGQTTLIVGSGYSAATSVVALARLADDASGTRGVWLTRTDRTPPIPVVDNDALTGRAALTAAANELALSGGATTGPIEWRPAECVDAIERTADDRLRVRTLSMSEEGRELIVGRIIAQVGYRPDRSLYEELQVHECYATQGPIKLAAALLGETSGDCLTQTSPGAATLRNPEPGFFILGAKSYGRDSRFLLRIGLEQIDAVFGLLEGATA